MGRCYEFGVLIGEGCEHAMVVPAAGGRCQCGTCGAACTGKFAACASIIDRPGYVPATAPAWAVAVGTPTPAPAPPSPPATDPAPRPASPDPAVGAVAGALVKAVAERLAEIDAELGARIDTLSEAVDELRRQNAQHAASLQVAITSLAEVVSRLDEGRPAPLFGFPRRPS